MSQWSSRSIGPANLPPPSRRRQVARNVAFRGWPFPSQSRNRARSASLLSQSRRNSTVLVCLKAERTNFDISSAVEAATTAQIRRKPVPKRPIPRPAPANLLKIQLVVCRIRRQCPYQKCKATLVIWLTRGVGPVTFARKSPCTAHRACFQRSYGMRARIAVLALSVFLGGAVSSAQNAPQDAPAIPQIDFSTVNCSGFVADQHVPDEIRIVSGEQSNYKISFTRGDYVHINRGQDKGVRVGDRFAVVRPDKDPTDVPWFKWQVKLLKAMGTPYVDAG